MAGRGTGRRRAGTLDDPADSFVEVDHDIQAAIRAESQQARGHRATTPRQVIGDAWDTPVTADPLIGEFNPALGHSTFIAGIVRQVAPDARVLAIRIMHSDDVVYEGDLLCALAPAGQPDRSCAEEGDPAGMVDVVSLSLGYFSESAHDRS